MTRACRAATPAGVAALSAGLLLAGVAATCARALDDQNVPASNVDGPATIWRAQFDYSCSGHEQVTARPYLITWAGSGGLKYYWYGENEGDIVAKSGPGYNEVLLNGGTSPGSPSDGGYLNVELAGGTMTAGASSCAKYVFTRTSKGLAQWECNRDYIFLHPIKQYVPWPAMAGGQSEGCYPLFGILPALPTMAIAAVTPTSDPLTVEVRVRLTKDAKADAAGCDPSASFSFDDQDLKSSTRVGACAYDLTFKQPATGIYHVAAHAYFSDGGNAPVTVDQYGADVQDGTFPVAIDSCAAPAADAPDVDALANDDLGVCDVILGVWDHDTAQLASEVISDLQAARGLEVVPVAVAAVDPADWPRDLKVVPETGWVPTGTAAPPQVLAPSSLPLPPGEKGTPIGVGNAVAYVYEVGAFDLPDGVPDQWDGAGVALPAAKLDDVPPATVIAAHGMWYVPNGLVRVPAGDVITTYVPIGTSMGNDLGDDVDTGNLHGKDLLYKHVYKPGDLIPDFTFFHLDLTAGHHVLNPASPTTLGALVKPHEGTIWIAACANLIFPKGLPMAKGLGRVAVEDAGSNTPNAYVSVTVTPKGPVFGPAQAAP